jgi:transcriptional regulator with XRE-family HTH domain
MADSQRSETLGAFLRRARDASGLTLRAVEKETGISNPYLSQLEGDKIKRPSPNLLHKICELYNVSYKDSMELAGYPTAQIAQQDHPPAGRNRVADRIGAVTSAEEDALVEYLAFLRSRRKKGSRS